MITPIALTIAGSDTSAGAGIQADLKTFSSLGTYGLTAITCIVSETPTTVSGLFPIPPDELEKQISILVKNYTIGAVKTGMLYSQQHIKIVHKLLKNTEIPLVVDPVMVATSGSSLLVGDAIAAYREQLLPLATVITPNLPEASVLLGREVTTKNHQADAARELAEIYKTACYLKGGHLENSTDHRDILVSGATEESFTAPHLDLPFTHGTGCTLSAALAAGLAKNLPLGQAAKEAHEFTQRALAQSHHWQNLSHLDQVQRPKPSDNT